MTAAPWLLAVLLLTPRPIVLHTTVEYPTRRECEIAAAIVRFDAPGLGLNLMIECYQRGFEPARPWPWPPMP